MNAPPLEASLSMLVTGAVGGLVLVAAAGTAWGLPIGQFSALWVLATIVSLSIAPLLTAQAFKLGGLWPLGMMLSAFGVALAYFGLHHVFGLLVHTPSVEITSTFNLVWVMVCFALLFAMQCLIKARPYGAVASGLYPWFYAGLYLDEWFTRMTFRIWPAKLLNTSTNNPAGVMK